jgi:NAD(P)H-binding
MKILIAGASGAIGRPLVQRLRADQHEVFALSRSPDSAPLREIGAEPVIADALNAAAVKAAVARIRPDAVINELTSLPRRYTSAETGQPRNATARSEWKATSTCLQRFAMWACAATCVDSELSCPVLVAHQLSASSGSVLLWRCGRRDVVHISTGPPPPRGFKRRVGAL